MPHTRLLSEGLLAKLGVSELECFHREKHRQALELNSRLLSQQYGDDPQRKVVDLKAEIWLGF